MHSPEPVADVMGSVGLWWAVAGGWAIDLWLGKQTRDHHDVEVVVRRCDQHAVNAALSADWSLFCLDPPGSGWQSWGGVPIDAPAFQLQARSSLGEFDLFTEVVDGAHWHFRRDSRIMKGSGDVIVSTSSGIPVVRPEIQLLYMAASTEPKNQSDFEIARPNLTPEAASWLRDALQVTLPGHRWLQQLT